MHSQSPDGSIKRAQNSHIVLLVGWLVGWLVDKFSVLKWSVRPRESGFRGCK